MMKSDMDKEELEERLNWYEKRYGPYIEKRGFNNWRNLFRKPTNSEWTILIMLILAMFIGWSYQAETAQCREVLVNLDLVCANLESPILDIAPGLNFTFKADSFLDAEG